MKQVEIEQLILENGFKLEDEEGNITYEFGTGDIYRISQLLFKKMNYIPCCIHLPTKEEIEQAANTLCPVSMGIDDGTYFEGKNVGFEMGADFIIEKVKETKQLTIPVVSKSLKVEMQYFDSCDCPYQINTYLEKHKIDVNDIISFSENEDSITMYYKKF